MKKWTCEAIIVAVVLCVGLGIWWFIATKDTRKAEAQYKQLVRLANRQSVEIAVIKQAAELKKLRETIKRTQKPVSLEIPAIVQPPVIADPTDDN